MNLIGELNCIGQCLRISDFAHLVTLLLVISIGLLAAKFIQKNPGHRLLTYVLAQVAVLVALLVTFSLMKCTDMLSVYLYFAYVTISSVVIFASIRFYDRLLIKRLNARPLENIINWTQGFVNDLTRGTVYYYDSAVPKAFAAGRSIFVSVGLLEILNDDELKAVLAHEAWHIRNNSRTPFLKQLAVMTFSSQKGSDLEELADRFAEKVTNSEALFSARKKVDKVFI